MGRRDVPRVSRAPSLFPYRRPSISKEATEGVRSCPSYSTWQVLPELQKCPRALPHYLYWYPSHFSFQGTQMVLYARPSIWRMSLHSG